MGKQLYVLTLLLALFHYGATNPIYGGILEGKVLTLNQHQREVNPLKTPYIVYIDIVDSRNLRSNLRNICGGAIIGSRTVLTTAHCLNVVQQPSITIIAGVLNLEVVGAEKAQVIKAEKHISHSDYKKDCKTSQSGYCANDIALIRTTEAFDFRPSIKAAVIAGSRSTKKVEKGWIYGWGQTETGQDSDHLRKALMNVSPMKTCQNAYKRISLSDAYWCLTADNHKSSACPGDSGGPFVVNGVIYGVYSFGSVLTDGKTGERRCDHYPPSVYINVIKYEKWLKEKVKELSPEDFKKHLKFDDGSSHILPGTQSNRDVTQVKLLKKDVKPQNNPRKPSNLKDVNQQKAPKEKIQIQQPQKNEKRVSRKGK